MVDEVSINKTTAGDQDSCCVAGLRGIQVVAVWIDRNSGNIVGRPLGTNGVPTGDEFNVNFPGVPGTRRNVPVIAEFSRGLVVAWTEQAPGGPVHLKLRTLDDEALSGSEIQVSSSEVEHLEQPALARLPDNGFIVVWADKRDDQRIRAQRFDIDGNKNGAEFRANTFPGLHRNPMVASLSNGNIVIGWRARTVSPLLVRLQVFNASGAPVGTEVTTSLNITDASMIALDGGRFAIASIRSALDGEPGFDTTVMKITLFEASGAPANISFAATSAGRIVSSWPMIAPLKGGHFLGAWTEQNVDNPAAGFNVSARVFSAAGPVGQVVKVNTRSGGSRFALSACATSTETNETAFMVWSTDDAAGPDTSGRGVQGRPLNVTSAGF